MSEENVEIVRSMYVAFNQAGETGNFASYVREVWDAECEYQPVEESEPVRGHDELVQWHDRWFEVWDEFRAEVDEIVDAGDAVMSTVTVRARGRRPGMELKQRFFHVCTVRDRKLLRMTEHLDRNEAVDVAGLRE
jgi:ketosteroid isomerase-like protein